MILLDASGLFEAVNGTQPRHSETAAALAAEAPPLILSPFVLAEVDYLTLTSAGVDAEIALLESVAAGQYELAPFDADDVRAASALVAKYEDLAIGLADASIVVLAERYGANRVLTFDERHFRALRTSDGRAFTVLPADA